MKARVLFPDPVGLLTRSPKGGLREMDDGSMKEDDPGLESRPAMDQQGMTPLYSSTPGGQFKKNIAPRSELWITKEMSHHYTTGNHK